MSMSGEQQPAALGQARVRFGAWTNVGRHSGKTVGDVRRQFEKHWKMPEGTPAYVGGNQVNDDTVITDSMDLEFSRKTGEKG